ARTVRSFERDEQPAPIACGSEMIPGSAPVKAAKDVRGVRSHLSCDRRLLEDAIDGFPELAFRQQILLLERLDLHLFQHGHALVFRRLDTELLAPLLD